MIVLHSLSFQCSSPTAHTPAALDGPAAPRPLCRGSYWNQAQQELDVGTRRLKSSCEELHGFRGAHLTQHFAQQPDAMNLFRGE